MSAPEVEKNEPHDISVDIWNLGQIIFQILTGLGEEYPLKILYTPMVEHSRQEELN